jgi:hypothetical protein
MKTSPTQRTLKLFRSMGYTCYITERWNPFAHIRQDLYGFIDVLAIKEKEIVGIQACAGASHAARRAKIAAEPNAKLWLLAGGKIALVSWSKMGERGKAKRWKERIEWVI